MKRFNYMALREKSACDLVYKLIGREIQVVLDPTLLFSDVLSLRILLSLC